RAAASPAVPHPALPCLDYARSAPMKPLRAKQKLGKYLIERKLGEGGFSVVYQAKDTIEGIRVALKVPHAHLLTDAAMEGFRKEVRLVARLEHPNILSLKNAQFIDEYFVIVTPYGLMTLDERLSRRLPFDTAMDYAGQMLSAVSYAHSQRIIHCDIKPDNFILFEGNRLRLTDFGVAKVAQRTLRASGAGTLGYMAPEQAMGRPSYRSDVFALGLVLYQMFSGRLPEYPFHWPPPGHALLEKRVNAGFLHLLRRALEVAPQKRFADARAMLAAFGRVKAHHGGRAVKKKAVKSSRRTADWKEIQRRQFQQEFGKVLDTDHHCPSCQGPVSESMQSCPWCGKPRLAHEGSTDFPLRCTRCRRGMKLDWSYCPWCYGPGFEPSSTRQYSDIRYTARCQNQRCSRKLLMPFMRYCPWCHRKVRRKWKLPESKHSCRHCGWGVASGYWSYCPWCAKRLGGQ
ncbi:MAG TPA: serine/threonine-protein kinase, partial [Lacipirellulaceae bacterium]|nr:serine/threonine-protein kinase [Lacipirellulaceae bacterium]